MVKNPLLNNPDLPHCCMLLLRLLMLTAFALSALTVQAAQRPLELIGISTTPHTQSPEMRYRRDPDPDLGARVQLFLRNATNHPLALPATLPVRFRGETANELLASGAWAWHDTPSAWPGNDLTLSPGALTVWMFNSRGANWGAGTAGDVSLDWSGQLSQRIPFVIEAPKVWLSAVTFVAGNDSVFPDVMVLHVSNQSAAPVRITSCQLWLPEANTTWRALRPQPVLTKLDAFPSDGVIPPGEKGGARVMTGKLPLTYAAVEVRCSSAGGVASSLWAHLRSKREVFDISGGWVASGLGGSNTLHAELYLKTLRRMHINAGMHQDVPGYSDTALFGRYPLKYMNRLQPTERYDTDAMLPRIHAAEFLGEPQYGGGRPVPPMDVWRAFAPYQATRLPTSVTHSEERVWRYYAGLSDYPHYDAYRVTAPSADAWSRYDRWGGERLRWGAPLETIGDLTRSLRELNRPMPIAYWSQGAHYDWGRYGGRARTSPTPDELRAQAYHALAQRITSLYWFNLSLKSLIKFRDLIDPITRVNREIRLMEDLLIAGDAFEYRRELRDGQPSWDLASVTGPGGGLFFALDLAYVPDPQEKVFKFQPREGTFTFRLPAYLSKPAEVFRIAGDGVHQVRFEVRPGRMEIQDRVNVASIFVVSAQPGLRDRLQARHAELVRFEDAFDFDPAGRDADFGSLRQLLL